MLIEYGCCAFCTISQNSDLELYRTANKLYDIKSLSSGDTYTIPYDGYVMLKAISSSPGYATCRIYGSNIDSGSFLYLRVNNSDGNHIESQSVFVKAGMQITTVTVTGEANITYKSLRNT